MRKLFLCFSFLFSIHSFAQTNFYSGGAVITTYSTAIVFVDGNIVNDVHGKIHNQGSIYFTGDWSNNEPSGCLDPSVGAVTMMGGAQFIKGTQTTTFNNLDLQGSGMKTLNINTIVGGNTGVLSLNNNPLNLNSNTLKVTNPATGAITRSSGYIISETTPATGYGRIQWDIGNAGSGNYIYPFGTMNGEYIPFLFNITTAGIQSALADLSVATYPTDVTFSPNNRPLPSGVTDLNDANGNESDIVCADRYWITDANNYSSNPTADITFTYRDAEWDASGGSNNTIAEDSLQAWQWNGSQWINPPVGADNASANTVSVTGANTFSQWTLKGAEPISCAPFYLPNAFSPNGDKENDVLYLYGNPLCLKSMHLVIFNRWGEKVFESTDINKGWDGSYKGEIQNTAVFNYYLDATLINGDKLNKKGNISLIR